MKTREERQWELIQQVLAAEASGKTPRPTVSKRTLFGIPSAVDEALEAIAAEEDARCRRLMQDGRNDDTPQD